MRTTVESNIPDFHPCPPVAGCPYCKGSPNSANGLDFDWSFLDAAYCISLKTREDRAASAAAQFHEVGLCRHVLFYRPQKHPSSPIVGIWDSHRAVGMHARERDCNRVLIMEDDILFKPRLQPRKVFNIVRALDNLPPDWWIFFLGHWPFWAYPVGTNILRSKSACAHAYIASRRLLRWLEDHPYDSCRDKIFRIAGHGIDAAYAELLRQLTPMVRDGLAAAIHTQTTDVETETNGLMTYDRKITKFNAARMRELAERLYRAGNGQ